MTAQRIRRNSVLAWLAGSALVVAAGAVTALTPSDDDLMAPFSVAGAVGDTVVSRTLVASVHGLSFADELATADGWAAAGNWLLIDLSVAAPTTEVEAEIGVATLVIDGRVFQASERPRGTLIDADLHVGLATSGVLAFELPDGIDTGTAELRLTGEYPTPHLDDVIAVSVRLDGAERVASTGIEEPRWGRS